MGYNGKGRHIGTRRRTASWNGGGFAILSVFARLSGFDEPPTMARNARLVPSLRRNGRDDDEDLFQRRSVAGDGTPRHAYPFALLQPMTATGHTY
jgi:hypothetical protein